MINNKDNYNIRIIIATVLSTILMICWIKYYGTKTLPLEIQQEKIEKKQEEILDKNKNNIETNLITSEEKKLKKNEKQTIIIDEKKLIINTKKLQGSINLRGLIFNNLILEDYKKNIESDEKVHLLSPQNLNNTYFIEFGWESEDKNMDLPNKNTLWKADSNTLTVNNPVVLKYENKDGLIFQIILSIDHNYMFTFKQIIINNTNKIATIKILNKIVKKEFVESDIATSVHEGFIGSFNNRIDEIKYKKLKKKSYIYDSGFSWAGFTDKYWLVSMASDKNKTALFDVKTNYNDGDYSINFITNNIVVNPKQSDESTILLFAGPKILNLLDQYAFQYDLLLFDRAVDFGWFYFLTKPIYIVLKTFYSFFGNFGVAILFLTFIVKSIMYPFTKKSFISMAKMKDAQPKIDALKAKYSSNKMTMNKELIALYKKENISPLSGCLPMLVQIPVFFSLYKVLAISIDMRQAPFFGYIKNLAEKDPTTILNLFGLLPFNPTFLHIGFLPCLMAFTMWIQQKLSSQGNTSAEMKTATKLMPIIFLVMFAGMPAGLLIYWTFSNIITIGQQCYVEKKLTNNKLKNNFLDNNLINSILKLLKINVRKK